jgi:hypothetical protein
MLVILSVVLAPLPIHRCMAECPEGLRITCGIS